MINKLKDTGTQGKLYKFCSSNPNLELNSYKIDMNPDPDRSSLTIQKEKYKNPGGIWEHCFPGGCPHIRPYSTYRYDTHIMMKLADLSIVCMLENCWRKPPSNSSTSILLEPCVYPPSFTPPPLPASRETVFSLTHC
jgi:hypothetical protein